MKYYILMRNPTPTERDDTLYNLGIKSLVIIYLSTPASFYFKTFIIVAYAILVGYINSI